MMRDTVPFDSASTAPGRRVRARSAGLLFLALALSTALPADRAAAGTLPPGPSALVIHGGDRTLAAIASPAGPAQANLATLGLFPNEILVHGTQAYVVCSGDNSLVVIDLLTGDISRTIAMGAGTNPYGIALFDDSRLYVSRLATNDLVAIDLPSGTIAATIPVGRAPEGLAVAAGRLFVANSGFDFGTFGYEPGTVSVIDPGTNQVTATLSVGLNPQALAVAPNGEVHVACTGDYFSVFGRAFVIDPAIPAVVDSVDLGASPGNIAVNPAGAAYLGDYFAGLLKYDTVTRTALRNGQNPIPVGTGATAIDFGDGLTWVCLYGDDAVITLNGHDAITQTFPVGDGPQDLVFHTPTPPVPVELAAVSARLDAGGRARLDWRTAAAGATGFHVDRGEAAAGPWSRRTARMIPAEPDGRHQWTEDAPLDSGANVWYRLIAVDRVGREATLATLALPPAPSASSFEVQAPRPNPLRGGSTTVAFRLARSGPVQVVAFDASGRPVRHLHDGALGAGAHELTWDGRGDSGDAVPGGLYFVRIEGADGVATRRVTVVGRQVGGL